MQIHATTLYCLYVGSEQWTFSVAVNRWLVPLYTRNTSYPITEKQDEQAAAGNSAAWLRRIEQLNSLVSISLAWSSTEGFGVVGWLILAATWENGSLSSKSASSVESETSRRSCSNTSLHVLFFLITGPFSYVSSLFCPNYHNFSITSSKLRTFKY